MSNKIIAIITAGLSFLSVTLNQNIFYGILSVGVTFVLYEIMSKMEMNGSFVGISNMFEDFRYAIHMGAKKRVVSFLTAAFVGLFLVACMVDMIFPLCVSTPICKFVLFKMFQFMSLPT